LNKQTNKQHPALLGGMLFSRTFADFSAAEYNFIMKLSNEQLKKLGKRAAAAAVGIVAALSLALGGVADSPDELFSGAPQSAHVIAAKADAMDTAAPEKKPTLRDRLRRLFLSQPSVVRGIVLLPLWAAGKALIWLLSALFAALSPVLQVILGVLLNAALLFGVFALIYKLLFPDKKLRDFLTKRNVILFVSGAILLSLTDTVLRIFWEDYRPVSVAVKLVAGLVVLALLSWRIFGKRLVKQAAQPV
jgi:hypothetical protein